MQMGAELHTELPTATRITGERPMAWASKVVATGAGSASIFSLPSQRRAHRVVPAAFLVFAGSSDKKEARLAGSKAGLRRCGRRWQSSQVKLKTRSAGAWFQPWHTAPPWRRWWRPLPRCACDVRAASGAILGATIAAKTLGRLSFFPILTTRNDRVIISRLTKIPERPMHIAGTEQGPPDLCGWHLRPWS